VPTKAELELGRESLEMLQRRGLLDLPLLEREYARRKGIRNRESALAKLDEFLRQSWEIVEPGRPLVWRWHIGAMVEHLQAVCDGQIRNLLITIPPGCTKSRLVGVFLPSWRWLHQAGDRWLFLSNNEKLATRESLSCRKLVESDWYRGFGMTWDIEGDQNTKTLFQNTSGGHRQSLGVRANVTGVKGEWIVVDDANDAKKVQSEADREEVNGKWDNSIYDRVTDFKTGRRIVIGQRTHQKDLIGHIKATSSEFEELRIPEEFEPSKRIYTPIGWTDPRTKEGELLRPEEFGPVQVESAKKRLGIIYRAKHQQDPASAEGYRFKAKNFRYWRWDGDYIILQHGDSAEYRFHATKEIKFRFCTVDGAASAKRSADHTVVSSWLVTRRYDLLWIGCRRVQLEIPEQPPIVQAEYVKHGAEFVDIEALMNNVALYQACCRLPGMVVNGFKPIGDKLANATPALVLASAGRLWFPDDDACDRAEFPLEEVQAEMLSFTGIDDQDEHDDIVDTLARAVRRLNDHEQPGSDGSPSVVSAPTPSQSPGRILTGGVPINRGTRPGITRRVI
jgi:phage terminase large subunit-like protein